MSWPSGVDVTNPGAESMRTAFYAAYLADKDTAEAKKKACAAKKTQIELAVLACQYDSVSKYEREAARCSNLTWGAEVGAGKGVVGTVEWTSSCVEGKERTMIATNARCAYHGGKLLSALAELCGE